MPISMTMPRTSCNPGGQEDQRALRPTQPVRGSQGVVRTVAEGLAAARFAPAQPHFFGRCGGERDGGQPGALVRAVAKGLRAAAPARTPEIPFPGLDGDAIGLLLRGYRCGHAFFPASALDTVASQSCGRAFPPL